MNRNHNRKRSLKARCARYLTTTLPALVLTLALMISGSPAPILAATIDATGSISTQVAPSQDIYGGNVTPSADPGIQTNTALANFPRNLGPGHYSC